MPILLQKSFWGDERTFSITADAFYERRCEGPYRLIPNRPGISVVALKSNTAAEKSKDQLSRDFPGRSIFDFCNNICQKRTYAARHKEASLVHMLGSGAPATPSTPTNLRTTRAGLPTARQLAGISLVTTLPAPIAVLCPMQTPGRIIT